MRKVSFGVAAAALTLIGLTLPGEEATAQRRPYAPKAQVPADAGNDAFLKLEINSLARAQVPALGEVEAPPYPGAVIVRTVPSRQLTGPDGASYETLPTVVLVSADAPGTVIAYYVQRLNGWNHNEIDDGYYFWASDEEFEPLAESGHTQPSVQILPAGAISLVPDAQSEIRVRYRPGGGLVVPS
jgi:hypothetical protein